MFLCEVFSLLSLSSSLLGATWCATKVVVLLHGASKAFVSIRDPSKPSLQIVKICMDSLSTLLAHETKANTSPLAEKWHHMLFKHVELGGDGGVRE